MNRQQKAYGLAVLTVFSWSTVATAFKISLRHLGFMELLLYSNAVAVVLLAAVLVATGRKGRVFRSTRAEWIRSSLLGLLNPFLYYTVLLRAYELLPAQQAQPLNYTWVLALAVLSVPLLGQRIGARDFAGLIVGYLGVIVVATRGRMLGLGGTDPAGVALAMASTVVWALYWIYTTKDTREPVVCLFQNFVCALAPAFVGCLCFAGLRAPPAAGLAGAAYVGAFEMSIPFVTWSAALRMSVNTAKVGGLILLSPCISLLFIALILREAVHPSTVAGLGLIVAGILIQKYGGKKAADGEQDGGAPR